jgi:hypothetical protein
VSGVVAFFVFSCLAVAALSAYLHGTRFRPIFTYERHEERRNPDAIPLPPNAKNVQVRGTPTDHTRQVTTFETSMDRGSISLFYRDALASDGWKCDPGRLAISDFVCTWSGNDSHFLQIGAERGGDLSSVVTVTHVIYRQW